MPTSDSELFVTRIIRVPLTELTFVYVRSSGPGGQNVNKVNSQAQMSWDLEKTEALPTEVMKRFREQQKGRITNQGVLRLDSQKTRDREKNKQDCLTRLREMLVVASIPPRRRKKTRVPRGVIEKRLRNKKQRSDVKRYRKRPGMDD